MKTMKNWIKTLALFCFLGLPTFSVLAQPANSAPLEPTSLAQNNLHQFVQSGINQIQSLAHLANWQSPQQVFIAVQKQMARYFDLQAMSQIIIGALELPLNTQQKTYAQNLIKQQFMKSFTHNLLNYRGSHIQLIDINNKGQYATARLYLYRPNTYPTLIDLRMHKRPSVGWRIYDVSADGLSAITHFRYFLHAYIQRSGLPALNKP